MALFDSLVREESPAEDTPHADDVGAEILARLKRLNYGKLPSAAVLATMTPDEKVDQFMMTVQAFDDAAKHFIPDDGPTEDWHHKLLDWRDSFSDAYRQIMDEAHARWGADGHS